MSIQTEERMADQAFLEAVARTMHALDQHLNQYIAKRLAENNIRTDSALQLSPRGAAGFRARFTGTHQ